MPIYEYKCTTHPVFEELHLHVGEQLPTEAPCPVCGAMSPMVPSLSQAIGVLWSKEEALSSAAGKPIKGNSDLDRIDREMWDRYGAVRTDPGSAAHRRGEEAALEHIHEVAAIRKEGGDEAVAAAELKEVVTDAAGFTDAEYVRWRDATESAAALAESGAVDTDAGATNTAALLGGDAGPAAAP